jgi:hypothetical protein
MSTKYILVVGTTFAFPAPFYGRFRRAADMIGRALARTGFGLVTGNPPGVDSVAAKAFWAECKRLGRAPEEAYQQLWLPHFWRGHWMPGRGFSAPRSCVCRLDRTDAWIERAMDIAGAAIMIGGRRSGSLTIARRFIDAGKPVLPIPFVGGESRNIFEEILRTWNDAPVPGLSQAQFLRLAVPWINDTGPLANLLLGTLAATQDIFISYRRSDTEMAAGRLHADLVDHFGDRRVFFDLHGILPSAQWKQTIKQAIDACKVGIVVIGPQFLAREEGGQIRLHDRDDVMRHELSLLMAGQKTILPVLVGGAQLPAVHDLPHELKPLVNYQAPSFDNANWTETVRTMIDAIEMALRPRPPQ